MWMRDGFLRLIWGEMCMGIQNAQLTMLMNIMRDAWSGRWPSALNCKAGPYLSSLAKNMSICMEYSIPNLWVSTCVIITMIPWEETATKVVPMSPLEVIRKGRS